MIVDKGKLISYNKESYVCQYEMNEGKLTINFEFSIGFE